MLEMKIKIEADAAVLKAIDKLTTALEKNAVNISVPQDTPAPVAPVAAPVTHAPVPPVTMPPATQQAWMPLARPWGLLRTSASSTPARRSSVIFASLAPLQRPMEAAPATCPSTTPTSGSCSKNTAARML